MFLNTDAIKEALYNKNAKDIAEMIEEELEMVTQEEAEKKATAEKAKARENEVSLLRDIAVEAVAEYFEALDVDVTDEDVEKISDCLKDCENLAKGMRTLKNKGGCNWTAFFA